MAGLAAIPATPPSSKRQSNEAPAPIASEAQSATLGALINRSGCFTRPLLILIAWVDGQGAPEMLKKLFLVLLVLACGYVEAKSEDSSQSREAQSKLQMDATQCWAYYEYVKKCVPDDKKVEINDRLRASLERSEILAFALGQSIGMTEDAQLARYKMALEEMVSLTKKSCFNISSLYVRHGERCKKMLEDASDITSSYRALLCGRGVKSIDCR